MRQFSERKKTNPENEYISDCRCEVKLTWSICESWDLSKQYLRRENASPVLSKTCSEKDITHDSWTLYILRYTRPSEQNVQPSSDPRRHPQGRQNRPEWKKENGPPGYTINGCLLIWRYKCSFYILRETNWYKKLVALKQETPENIIISLGSIRSRLERLLRGEDGGLSTGKIHCRHVLLFI